VKTLQASNGKDLAQTWLVKLLVAPVPAEDASVGCQPYPEILRTHDQTQAAVFEFSHRLVKKLSLAATALGQLQPALPDGSFMRKADLVVAGLLVCVGYAAAGRRFRFSSPLLAKLQTFKLVLKPKFRCSQLQIAHVVSVLAHYRCYE